MKRLGYLAVMLVVVALALSLAVSSETVRYRVGPYNFNVPGEFAPDLGPYAWIWSVPGLDQESGDFIFEFPGRVVSSAVDGYVPEINAIDQLVIGRVYFITDAEIMAASDPARFANLWYAKGRHANREVVFDADSGLYLVFEAEGHRGLLYIFSKAPESTLPARVDDFWVASCHGNGRDLQMVRCSRDFLIRPNLMVSFNFSLESLKVHEQIRMFLADSISAWII